MASYRHAGPGREFRGAVRIVALGVTAGVWLAPAAGRGPANEPATFADLSLEELLEVKVISATLTPTLTRLVPAQISSVDEWSIERSGARTLNELLEIYTPNTQLILHNAHLDHFGIRGIISDRDDKYLLRVNGRVMNNRFLVGAESERDLPLLGDFRVVSLVQGPGSATYGAGALAGVVNLETHTGLTFEGQDVHFRQGFRDQFTAGEVRFGHRLSERSGLFLYAGVADQPGADQKFAPQVFGASFATPGAAPDVVSGEPVSFEVPNLRDQGDLTKAKFHASYVQGPVEVWARFTQGGGLVRPRRTILASTEPAAVGPIGDENRQFTVVATFRQDLTPEFNLEAMLSYDSYNLVHLAPARVDRDEKEAFARVLGAWRPVESQSLAVGVEYSREWFDGARRNPPSAVEDQWETDRYAVLAEHQWTLGPRWTSFVSARGDKHTYTGWLFSPRFALVFSPDESDTLKLIVAQAQRRSGDGELRQQYVLTGTHGDIETLDSVELRFERQHAEHWFFGVSAFVESNEAIGYASDALGSIPVGDLEIWGVTPEVTYRTASTRVALSHGYTQLFDATANAFSSPGITARPFGYGSDLANWADHITKLAVVHDLDERWSVSTSLRLYWGFPGARDLAQWNAAQPSPTSLALADPGYDEAYGASAYWNAGLEFRPNPRTSLRLDAFNILGWADETLNKRVYYFRGSDYSSEAASVAVSARLKF